MSLDYKTDVEYNYSRRDALVTGGKVVLGAVGALLGLDFLAGCDDNSSRQSGLRVSETPRGSRVGMPAVPQKSPARDVEQEARELVQKLYEIGSRTRTKNWKENREYGELFIDVRNTHFCPPTVRPLQNYEVDSIKIFDDGREVVVDGVERVGERTSGGFSEGALDQQIIFFLKRSYGQLKIDRIKRGTPLLPGDSLAKTR